MRSLAKARTAERDPSRRRCNAQIVVAHKNNNNKKYAPNDAQKKKDEKKSRKETRMNIIKKTNDLDQQVEVEIR